VPWSEPVGVEEKFTIKENDKLQELPIQMETTPDFTTNTEKNILSVPMVINNQSLIDEEIILALLERGLRTNPTLQETERSSQV